MSDQFDVYLPHIRRRWLAEQAGWETRRQEAWQHTRQIAALLQEQFRNSQTC